MSETSLTETAPQMQAVTADMAQASRPMIMGPEHHEAQGDRIHIHVTNNTIAAPIAAEPGLAVSPEGKLEQVKPELSTTHAVSATGTLEQQKSGLASVLGVSPEVVFMPSEHSHTPAISAPVTKSIEPAVPDHDPLIVDIKNFKKAEKNLAEYVGSYLADAHASELGNGGLELEIKNRLALKPTADAMGALEISLSGPMIESNQVLAFTMLITALSEHPVIGPLMAAKKEQEEGMLAGPYSEGDAATMKISLDALSPKQYAELINGLAALEHAQPIHAEAEAQTTPPTPAPAVPANTQADSTIPGLQFETSQKDITTGTVYEQPGEHKPTEGTIYETPKGVGKEADIAQAATINASAAESKQIPLGIAAEAATRVAIPAQAHGKIGQMTLDQQASQAIRA